MGHIVVVGAGQAGASLTARLRAKGYDGDITLIGEEPVPPYQRPPLSKGYLAGELPRERLWLHPEAFWGKHDITLRTDTKVAAIDPEARQVRLRNGESLRYDDLALTTGAAPRRLPGGDEKDMGALFAVHDMADIDAMAPLFQPGKRVLILGGGYIGLEMAAVARKLGLEVRLVERAPRVLCRTSAPVTSDFFHELHRGQGVHLHLDQPPCTLVAEGGRAIGGALADGRVLPADFVVAGIGVVPRTDLAEVAGIACDNGIAVDARGRTSANGVWAAGDCASFPFRGGRVRLESVQNAIDQANAVADNILGAERDYDPVPWFWSDQYDVKLQIAGLNDGYAKVHERAGAKPSSVSHWYYGAEGQLLAVDAMNDPRAYMVGKRLLEAGLSPPPGDVCRAGADLKRLLA